MMEAWAPSTQACYFPKGEAFKRWCLEKTLDPFSCPLPKVLEYLQQLGSWGRAPSTIRVYASAIAAHRGSEVDSIFSSPAGSLFFKGLARSRPPKRPFPPTGNLIKVLRMPC